MKSIIRMLMVVLRKDADDEDDTLTYSAEEVGTRRSRREKRKEGQQPWDLTVERAAEIIAELPSDISRESAARIVRGALAAVGIEVSNLERITRARESKLGSEIELVRNRQKEFREKAEEAVRCLEEEIKTTRETYGNVLAEEEKKLSRASAALREVRRVRAFFDFPKTEGEENTNPIAQDAQHLRVLKTQEEGGGSGPPAAADSNVSVQLSNRARASCKSLLAIEVDAFDEFVAKLRGEHAQESPRYLE